MVEHEASAGERAHEFMELRPRLVGIAYRMLGTMWDAEDIVADAMVRWLDVDREQIREPVAYLTTMVTRRALDQLRSARVTRERYIGPWLPEPVITNPSPLGPLDTVERRESVSLATMRMMERLTPPERGVFVLHEAFDLPHEEIATVLDITEANSRQHLHRARSHIGDTNRHRQLDADAHGEMLQRIIGALESGDLEPLRDALGADTVAYSDGGGRARAARQPIVGSDRIAQFIGAWNRRVSVSVDQTIEVNGRPAAMLWFGQQYQLFAVDVRAGGVREVYSIMNPAKLRYLRQQLHRPE